MARAKRKKESRLPEWAPVLLKWLLFVLAVGLFVGGTVYLVVFRNPVFKVKEIESNVSLPQNLKADLYGKNIFLINLPSLYERLQDEFPFAKRIVLIRNLPNKLTVRVDLRRPIMFVRQRGVIFPIDDEGFVLEANMSLPRDVIELKLDPDLRLEEGVLVDSEAVFSAIALWKALHKTGLWDVFDFEYIDAYQPYELRVKIKNGPVWKLRGGNYKEKLLVFKDQLLETFLSDLPKMGPGSYVLFLEDGTITVNPS